MKNEEKKLKKRKKIKKGVKVLILILLILILTGILGYLVLQDRKGTKEKEEIIKEEEEEEEIIVEDESKYKLSANPTKYQEELNEEINTLIETEGYSEQALAELVAKNFIVEYYTLSNVTTSTPGGLQYVPTELKERFEDFASYIYDFYSYYENRDKLSVKDIKITNTKSIKYTYDDDLDEISTKKNSSGYQITLNWSYENGDDATTIVKVVKWNDDYGVVSVQN